MTNKFNLSDECKYMLSGVCEHCVKIKIREVKEEIHEKISIWGESDSRRIINQAFKKSFGELADE